MEVKAEKGLFVIENEVFLLQKVLISMKKHQGVLIEERLIPYF